MAGDELQDAGNRPPAARSSRAMALVVGVVVAGAAAASVLWIGPTLERRVSRTSEAVGDLALPVTSELTRRERGELVRAELARFVLDQQRFLQENGRVRQFGEVPAEQGDFRVIYQEMTPPTIGWLAEMRHAADGRRAISCAVAVGRAQAYVSGIVLRNPGEVRCSEDLSTRINRIWRAILPLRFQGR